MDLPAVNEGIARLIQQLRAAALLDDQFSQLLQLQDESNPDFVQEIVELYFTDSASKIEKLEQRLGRSQPDYADVDQLVHQFKGSSASFGAHSMAQLCAKLRESCQAQDQAGCQTLVLQAREVFQVLKSQLEVFLQLEKHRKQLERQATAGRAPI
ncbi:hypothetical protein WJX84_011902 [Apatococcus fuscideae]|uniref:Histidine-containing phosphotransfer protein n=1 Tax=Apatococcus fuscideae TaxID=2026836 RepID=A0AAW1TMM7_9CHLO